MVPSYIVPPTIRMLCLFQEYMKLSSRCLTLPLLGPACLTLRYPYVSQILPTAVSTTICNPFMLSLPQATGKAAAHTNDRQRRSLRDVLFPFLEGKGQPKPGHHQHSRNRPSGRWDRHAHPVWDSALKAVFSLPVFTCPSARRSPMSDHRRRSVSL